MSTRRKTVSIKLNIDELYLLGERIIWKTGIFFKLLNTNTYSNYKSEIRKKIKSYIMILNKITTLDHTENVLFDININLKPNDVLILWDIVNRLDYDASSFLSGLSFVEDPLLNIIDEVNRCNIDYKDLELNQKQFIYLYTEIALSMINSKNQNISVDGRLLYVRKNYISDYLSDYKCIFETDKIFNCDLSRSFYIIEPRYNDRNLNSISLDQYSKRFLTDDTLYIFNITEEALGEAQSFLDTLDKNDSYLLETDNSDILDELELYIDCANETLKHKKYGPGWRLSLYYDNFFDLDGNQTSGINLSEDVFNKLTSIDILNLNKSILSEEDLNNKQKLMEQLRYSHDCLNFAISNPMAL